MDLRESIDLVTGDHVWQWRLTSAEIIQAGSVGRHLPKQLTDSEKLSDKFVILSILALSLEEVEAKYAASKEWPT